MYYKARGKRFTFYGGIFPRKNLLGRYGLNIFAPYYWFIDPNARGFLLQFQNHYSPSKPYYGHAEFMLDWFGGNCYNTCKFGRNPYGNAMDRFQMNGSVAYNFFKDLLGIGGYFVLFHNEDKYLLNGADGMQFNEKKAIDNNNIYLMDRLYFNAYIGTSLLDIAPFMEKLNASFGMVSESSRLRQIHNNVPFMNSVGGQLDVEIQYKGFGIHNLFSSPRPQKCLFITNTSMLKCIARLRIAPRLFIVACHSFKPTCIIVLICITIGKTTSHPSASTSCLMRCVGALIGACLGQNLIKCI